MILLLMIFVIVCIGALVAFVRSKKSAGHIFAEAKLELCYNLAGTKGVLEDILMKGKNKAELFKNSNKTVIVTGGTRGIGPEIIKMFLKCDMHVIIGCRTPESGEKLIKQLRKEDPLLTEGQTEVYKLDVSSLESVREFSAIIKEKYSKIDVLLNCAGIMYVPLELTKDGFESQFATNYLGHFYLTHLLFPEIKAAGSDTCNARVVNVSSCAHSEGFIDFDDINGTQGYYLSWKAYAQSKLAQVLFSNHLDRILRESKTFVQVHSVHPGIVNTDLFDGTYLKSFFPWFINLVFKNPIEGAMPIVHTCISPALEGRGGTYISNCRSMATSNMAKSVELQEKFFKYTCDLLKIEEFGKS